MSQVFTMGHLYCYMALLHGNYRIFFVAVEKVENKYKNKHDMFFFKKMDKYSKVRAIFFE